jgi:hypothetical protein
MGVLYVRSDDTGQFEAVKAVHVVGAEAIRHADIPDYVKAEALRVANLVQAARKSDSIVFLAMSDNHHYGAQKNSDQYPDASGIQTDESNLHAAMAAKILAYTQKFDFMAHLGDTTWGSQKTTSDLLKQQGNEFYAMMKESHKDIPCFHAIGNHDTGIYYHNQMIADGKSGVHTESGEYLYGAYTALSESTDTVFGGTENGGYCYRDFSSKRLRVFLLNTSEALTVNQSDSGMLGSQRKWFADALINLNSKSDAGAWRFIVLSHYPADYGNTMPMSNLLKAYVDGTSITITLENGSSSTVNFSGKNSAKMIAQFHGHVHNFLASKLYSGSAQYDAWRVCIPNGQYSRENYYGTVNGINFKEDVSYGKTAQTGKDTSFVVNVVNPSEQKIYSFCYGAGIDRVIGYAGKVYYPVIASLTNVTLSNSALSVEAGQPYNTTMAIPDGYEWKRVVVTMGGTDITSSVYSNGVINIPAVTGNVTITASATEITNYTNMIPLSTDASGNIYNDIGYKDGVYLSSGNEGSMSGSYATGFIPCKIGDKLYCKNLIMKTGQDAHRVSFYDSSKKHLATLKTSSTGYPGWHYGADGNIDILGINSSSGNSNTAYIRLCCSYIGDDSVITVNEEIV